jgi:hypothetical protein
MDNGGEVKKLRKADEGFEEILLIYYYQRIIYNCGWMRRGKIGTIKIILKIPPKPSSQKFIQKTL